MSICQQEPYSNKKEWLNDIHDIQISFWNLILRQQAGNCLVILGGFPY